MENTARVFYEQDCDLSLLYGKTIAVTVARLCFVTHLLQCVNDNYFSIGMIIIEIINLLFKTVADCISHYSKVHIPCRLC